MKYWTKLKKNLRYSSSEIRQMFIGVFFMAFILSFNDWGVKEFSLFVGIGNLFLAFLIVLVSVFLRDIVQRLFASWIGIKVKFELWWIGVLIALAFAFLTNGAIKLFFLGGIALTLMKGKRIGKFYLHLSHRTMSIVAVSGPLTNIALAIIGKTVGFIVPGVALLDKFVLFNLVYALLALLPIPPLDGSKMFYHSRLVYAFVFGSVLGYLIFSQIHWAWASVWALSFGLCFLIVFYYIIEKTK